MEEHEFKIYYEQEDSHWWFLNRYAIFLWFLSRILNDGKDTLRVLDIGCGTAGLLKRLEIFNNAETFGMDASKTALAFGAKRNISHLVQADAMKIPFKDQTIDVAVSCEVLDHASIIPDTALSEIYRVCKKDSWLIISDVSFEFLRSEHDKVYHTKHRFNKRELYHLLTEAGFKIVKLSYYNFLLFPLVTMVRLARKFSANTETATRSDLRRIPAFINESLFRFLKVERELIKSVDLPWGTSVLCIAKKE